MDVKYFIAFDVNENLISFRGDWSLINLSEINKQILKLKLPKSGDIAIDAKDIFNMDSAGALIVNDLISKINSQKLILHLKNTNQQVSHLLAIVKESVVPLDTIPERKRLNWLANFGKLNLNILTEVASYLHFIGVLTAEFLWLLVRPHKWRISSLTNVVDTAGCKALPIIALLSFMIGVVISYQMGNYLKSYGANIYIVNLLGLSILREFGPLITAIMIAGRTGSAFTAELGIMKINQELDALNTMGVSSSGLLLLPRILGLVIALPLLTMWADFFGTLGGMLMAESMLNISYYDFLQRFQHEIPLRSFLVGLYKAPVFALIISSIGCFQGMQVSGSAESVGKLTTKSVVLSIFFIIVADAIFSIIFSRMNI
ncbi:ABC transporter permease [Gammaproteobacteria bacterium]|nr:ABC transporter permease [Gammaproteobacteria bacterium]